MRRNITIDRRTYNMFGHIFHFSLLYFSSKNRAWDCDIYLLSGFGKKFYKSLYIMQTRKLNGLLKTNNINSNDFQDGNCLNFFSGCKM